MHTMKLKNTSLIYLTSVIVSFGSFVFGYSLVCISLMQNQIESIPNIKIQHLDYYLTVITTLLPLGALIGTFTMKPLCDKFGQHKAMLILDVLAILALMIQGLTLDIIYIYVGRLMVGIYVGIATGMIPVYLISLSPPQISGIIGSFNQLLITIGIAVSYYFGLTIQQYQISNTLKWTYYMCVPILFCIIRIVTLVFFRFDTLERHFRKNQKTALQRYTNLFYENGTVDELIQIRMLKKQEKSINKQTYNSQDRINKQVLKLAVILAIANQLSGINAILFYAKQVFLQISQNNQKMADKYVLNLGLLQVIVTFVSGFLINKFGRRTLMIIGECIVAGALLIGFGVDFFVEDSSKYLIIIVFVHIIGFSLSLGPVSMIYVAQIMQNVSIVVIVIWSLTLFVAMVSEIMITNLGIGKVFLFYGVISTLCLWYIWRHMVESKGLTRQQLLAKIEKEQIIRLHEEEGTMVDI